MAKWWTDSREPNHHQNPQHLKMEPWLSGLCLPGCQPSYSFLCYCHCHYQHHHHQYYFLTKPIQIFGGFAWKSASISQSNLFFSCWPAALWGGHKQALTRSRESRDPGIFSRSKSRDFFYMKSRDFSGSAWRVKSDFLRSVRTFGHGPWRSKYFHSEDTFENT